MDRTRIRWDEPIVLTIRVDNPTAGDVRVSWPTDGAAGDAQGAADDATQVAALMDVADFLAVSAPSGESVELRVDPIEQDTAVHRVVSVRAGAAPPSQVIPPGGSARLTVPQWNRGWARFPTLGRGTYSIRFEYQPPWKDAAWIAQGVGAVLSNTVQIEVVEPAPPSIQQATRPMELRLREEHHQIIGELRNLWDRELYINLNMGGPLETHARLEWCRAADAGEAGPFTLEGDATGRDFAPERLKVLAPGETARVADSAVALLLKQARSPSAGDGEPVEVALRYVHLATPDALRRSLRQKGRRESIPTQVFSGAVLIPGIRLVPDP